MTRIRLVMLMLFSICLFSFIGCEKIGENLSLPPLLMPEEGETTSSPIVAETDHLSLPYDRMSPLNPFQLTTQINKMILPLLYESLYLLDETFTPVPLLAVEGVRNGNSYTITLKDGIVFSDGSSMGVDDLLYSFEQAASSTAYQAQLEGVIATIEDGRVVFSLAQEDAFFLSLLTFPIVKMGTAGDELPIGSGKYRPEGDNTLLALDHEMKIQTINLITPPMKEELSYSIRGRMLDLYYLDFNASLDYTIGAQTRGVPTTNLVYIGINHTKGAGADPLFRKTLHSLISRSGLVQKSYKGRGIASYTPIHPGVTYQPSIEFGEQFNPERLSPEGSLQVSEEKLTLNGEDIQLTLVVNLENAQRVSAAEEISKMLSTYGIGVTVNQLPYEGYLSAVRSGNFDLYLGETKLKDNMSLDEFILPEGSLRYGMVEDEELANAYLSFRKDRAQIDHFILTFLETPSFIPLLFREGAVAISKDIPLDAVFYPAQIYFDLTMW